MRDQLTLTVPHPSAYHAAVAVLAVTTLYLIYTLIIRPNYLSSLRNVPGPPNESLVNGNLKAIFKAEPSELFTKWIKEYGPVHRYRAFFGQDRLYVADPKALGHVLMTKSYDYPKPSFLRGQLARILGRGILFAEGDDHKRQRRIMNTPFTQSSTNSYYPTFLEHTNKLKAKLNQLLEDDNQAEKNEKESWTVVEITGWLARTTLDVIGRTGFDYDFGALDNTGNELATVFAAMLKPRKVKAWMILLQALAYYFPFLLNLPTKSARAAKKGLALMESEGRKMLSIREDWAKTGELDEKKDLMSLIFKANLQAGRSKDRMQSEELMGQITTFILAGHETSATALAWILVYLSQRPEIQDKLRKELRDAYGQIGTENRTELSLEELNSLPYMNAVIRETLRCKPPVYMTMRGTSKDDVIPLSQPIRGKDGKLMDAISVKKGQQIAIGIYNFNHSEQIFGSDANEFRPERWLEEGVESNFQLAKGYTAWSSLLTFLGGPRGCIGYRFALLEIKTILAMLVNSFEFSERDPEGTKLSARTNIVTRPVVFGEEEAGARLPLRMRRSPAT